MAHKISTLAFLVPSSLVLAYSVFYLANSTPSHAKTGSTVDSAPVRIIAPAPSEISLVKGQTLAMGPIELTYQGLNAGSVVIDITLLDLDPNYAYRRKIPESVAKQGFSLAQKRYQLISAGHHRLRMVRISG